MSKLIKFSDRIENITIEELNTLLMKKIHAQSMKKIKQEEKNIEEYYEYSDMYCKYSAIYEMYKTFFDEKDEIFEQGVVNYLNEFIDGLTNEIKTEEEDIEKDQILKYKLNICNNLKENYINNNKRSVN